MSAAAQSYARDGKRDPGLRYFTTAEAAAEMRCLCEGCAACRGEPGHPCAWALNEGERCRWCAR